MLVESYSAINELSGMTEYNFTVPLICSKWIKIKRKEEMCDLISRQSLDLTKAQDTNKSHLKYAKRRASAKSTNIRRKFYECKADRSGSICLKLLSCPRARASAVNASLHLTYMTRDSAVAQRRGEFTAVRCSTDRRFSSPFTAVPRSSKHAQQRSPLQVEIKRLFFFFFNANACVRNLR